MSETELIENLTTVKGIGRWTAGEPDTMGNVYCLVDHAPPLSESRIESWV